MKPTTTLVLGAAVLAAVSGAALWFSGLGFGSGEDRDPGATEAGSDAKASLPPPARLNGALPESRIAVAEPVSADGPTDFDGYVQRLVEFGVRMWQAVEEGQETRAHELDGEARALLTQLHNRIADTGAKALDRLTLLMGEDTTVTQKVRRRVLGRILADDLAAKWRQFRYGGPRSAADGLVEAMLRTIPQDELLADDLGTGMLANQPYLGPAHEDAILDLVELVPEHAFLEDVACELLLTLWNNLEESGARTPGSLASLAMLFKDDGNPARRLAALRHLLVADGGRYRELVVRQVLSAKDEQLANEVAHAAARELDPAAAIEVLDELLEVGGERITSAFMVLGSRGADLVAETYEQKLADNTEPALRAELVTAAGFGGGPEQVDVARLAFEHDPDPEVRTRALFALTSTGDPQENERILIAALDDPRHRNDPRWAGSVALALRNLAASADPNVLHRIGQRLRVRNDLLEQDRRNLEQFLAEHLPAGGQQDRENGR